MGILDRVTGYFREPTEEELYERGMEQQRQSELDEERQSKVAEASAKMDVEYQQKLDEQRRKVEAERIEREAIKALPSEERKMAEQEYERKSLEKQYQTAQEELERKKKRAELEYSTKQLKSRIAEVSEMSGASAEALKAAFIAEYRKIAKLGRQGKTRPEDVYQVRSIATEFSTHGADEGLVTEITKLRRRIENQRAMKAAGKALESVPRIGGKTIAATAALVGGRSITVGPRGELQVGERPQRQTAPGQLQAAAYQQQAVRTVPASDVLSPSKAKYMFETPIRRASPEQQFSVPAQPVMRPMRGGQQVVGVQKEQSARKGFPTMKDILGV